jgi:hypothetical protein
MAFHYKDGIYFERLADGSVHIFRRLKDGDPKQSLVTVDPDGWASAVLSVSAYGERPGDWHAFVAHHKGHKDMLEGQRGRY